jgi:hypothetical protein
VPSGRIVCELCRLDAWVDQKEAEAAARRDVQGNELRRRVG